MAAAAVTADKFVRSTSASVPTTNAVAPSTNNTNGLTSYGYEEVVLEDHQQKVPIWVGLNCKLVSGISKSTTCHDLISSIVPSSQDPSKYVLIEKWKKMERMLDPSVKILKVWKAWGDQIADVSFILRSSSTADGYIDKKSSRKVHRKRSSSHHHHQKVAGHEEDSDKEEHRDAMEQLIKLVLTQGEAIQAQLKKLRQQEAQIDRYEERMHKIRSSQLGENYVVETYLKGDTKPRKTKRREKSPCKKDAHGGLHRHHHHHRPHNVQAADPEVEKEPLDVNPSSSSANKPSTNRPVDEYDGEEETDLPESTENIQERTELMENIFHLNVRLTQEEERLVKLGLKIRKLSDKQRKAEWEELALQDITQELEHLKEVTNEQTKEIELNENNLTALEQLLDDKHDHVAFLTHEIKLIDEQSEMLQRKVLELTTGGVNFDQVYQSDVVTSSYATIHHPLPSTSEEPAHYFESVEEDTTSKQVDGKGKNLKGRGVVVDPSNSFKVPTLSMSNPPSTRYKCQQHQHETCTSSCSNSSSVCVQLTQKQCGGSTSSDPQDNDSNSDTGISSLHSSVDENPMFVLDTLV
ncbi:unnamed protein product [Orchesella dallaii]|uniref:Ras-associating domain-containing protein n=1 Tax=Orchesella dallaii TaxID=48710 RepID=A0ABP1PVU7_9HEXA